ncbi:MAG: hypothetical protein HRT61_17545 [Ekhidna sp.]|nr:hypothetical protein [Ekhidna sp.]
MESVLQPIIGWQIHQKTKSIPNNTARKIKALDTRVKNLDNEASNLSEKVDLINKAHEAAESLPIDLEELKDARDQSSKINKDISKLLHDSESDSEQINALLTRFDDKEKEVNDIIKKSEEAYRIATTAGLAAAFELRAINSSRTLWIWVVGLIASLISSFIIGNDRIELLTDLLENSNTQSNVLWINLLLSIFGLGVPIWFAWLSTKQISQRFRLSEDYHYKASVAKAYEGYRKEASNIDAALEKRLFESALERLEESPLRLLEDDNYGSPLEDLNNSEKENTKKKEEND